jgi:hypothetical protein
LPDGNLTQRDVARTKALPGGGCGGHDEHTAGAEAQVDDGAIPGCETYEGAVEGLPERDADGDDGESDGPRGTFSRTASY